MKAVMANVLIDKRNKLKSVKIGVEKCLRLF
jgi:hypothetical protein